jgi:hypothetical protein
LRDLLARVLDLGRRGVNAGDGLRGAAIHDQAAEGARAKEVLSTSPGALPRGVGGKL